MSTHVEVSSRGDRIKVSLEITITPGQSMMDCEEQILQAVNQVGAAATAQCLRQFDTDGSPLTVAGTPLTSKGRIDKTYQTPFGEVRVPRHVYQSGWGGATYCPLDRDARIINSSTPRFARMAAYKYTAMKSTLAQKDLAENHGRQVSRCYLQDITSEVAAVAEDKQDRWRYQDPKPGPVVNTIALGIDGTSVLFCDEGYRQAMVGTIAAYDDQGRRLHTVYLGAEPEYGKHRFFARMEREIAEFKERYPWAQWVGVADGAADLWPWLEQHTDQQILDFFHASGYLGKAVAGVCPRPSQRQSWLDERAHQLKHERGATSRIIAELKQALSERKLGRQVRSDLTCALGYFENHRAKMNYPNCRRQNLPIGSGVTEAACKRVVKERMCGSGMKWKSTGAGEILRLRSLLLSNTRWNQFWAKISQFGI